MNVVFVGTPEFAATVLSALLDSDVHVVGVITQPDRPQGRRRRPTPPPVKTLAVERGVQVFHPEDINDPGSVSTVSGLSPDALVVAAYGQRLGREMLDAPRLMTVNVHPSLLPRWRGAAPVPWAIMSGDRETGVTIMRMVEEMDAGEILAQESTPIGSDETAGELEARLARLSGPLLLRALRDLQEGRVSPQPQPGEGITTGRQLRKKDGAIDWAESAETLARRIRGLTPWPGAYSFLRTGTRKAERLVIAQAVPDMCPSGTYQCGEVVDVGPSGIVAAAAAGAGGGALRILRIQPAGKRAMSATDFLNGREVRSGDRFLLSEEIH